MAKFKIAKKYPRIYRLLTERRKKFIKRHLGILMSLKFQISIFLLGFFVVVILVLILDLLVLFQRQKEINFEKAKLNSEINLWQNIVAKYPSKDTYFRLAQLEYRVGNIEKSKYYTDKSLYSDPNFIQAQELKKILRSY